MAAKGNAGVSERIVRGDVIPGIEARRIPGFRSIGLVPRNRDHDVEFMTLMWFDTLDSVRGFMGEGYETAHVPPQAQGVLAGYDALGALRRARPPRAAVLTLALHRTILQAHQPVRVSQPVP
jgi:hypothetical protein